MTDSQSDLFLALAASPNFKRDKLLFVGRRSGLYRSNDEGKSWESQSIIAGETLSVTALAFSPDFIHDQTVFAALPGGVAYSHDTGNTWLWTKLPAPPPYISALALLPNFENDKTLFAATLEDGVLRSVDGGVSWQSWNFGLLDKQILCLALNDEAVYAGASIGLFCSHNDGCSWREISMPVEDSVLSLAVKGEHLFAGTEAHGLFTSADDGKTWKQIKAKGLESPINQIQVSVWKEASVRVLAGNELMESSDIGKSWHAIQASLEDEPVFLTDCWRLFSGLMRMRKTT